MDTHPLIAQIIGTRDLNHKRVDVPEWGFTGDNHLTVRRLPVSERLAFSKEAFGADGKAVEDSDFIQLAYCIGDKEGTRIFTTSPDHLLALKGKNPDVLRRLYEQSDALNWPPKAVENAEKN